MTSLKPAPPTSSKPYLQYLRLGWLLTKITTLTQPYELLFIFLTGPVLTIFGVYTTIHNPNPAEHIKTVLVLLIATPALATLGYIIIPISIDNGQRQLGGYSRLALLPYGYRSFGAHLFIEVVFKFSLIQILITITALIYPGKIPINPLWFLASIPIIMLATIIFLPLGCFIASFASRFSTRILFFFGFTAWAFITTGLVYNPTNGGIFTILLILSPFYWATSFALHIIALLILPHTIPLTILNNNLNILGNWQFIVSCLALAGVMIIGWLIFSASLQRLLRPLGFSKTK